MYGEDVIMPRGKHRAVDRSGSFETGPGPVSGDWSGHWQGTVRGDWVSSGRYGLFAERESRPGPPSAAHPNPGLTTSA